MNGAIIMMLVVSGGFAALAVLGAAWWFASGQYRSRREGAAIPLDDDREWPAAAPAAPKR